jgi:hypothetical protein
MDFRSQSVKKGRFAAFLSGSLPPKRSTQKMPAQKGNRSKKKLSNRAGSKKAALKRRRARERRK